MKWIATAYMAVRQVRWHLALVALTSSAPVTLAQPSGCVPAPSGMVAWWPGDGDGNDLTGDHNAVVEGGLGFTGGQVAQGFSLNGLDSTVRIPSSSSLNVGLAVGLTIEAWINPESVSDNEPVVEWSTVPPESPSFGVHLWVGFPAAGSLFANLPDASGQWHMIQTAPGAVQANVFQHVALTYDKATGMGRLFLNGAMVVQQSLGSFTPQTAYDLYIGQRPPGHVGSAIFRGTIDEASLYDRALDSNELAAIYAAGTAGKCKGQPVILGQPASQTAVLGSRVTLDVVAGGTPSLHYQWRCNGTSLPGATEATFTIDNLRFSHGGTYSVEVTNRLDRVVSSNALLVVMPPSLQISPSAGSVIIWWTINASEFALETASSLGGDPIWARWNGPVLVFGDQNVVAAGTSSGQRFFRLRKL